MFGRRESAVVREQSIAPCSTLSMSTTQSGTTPSFPPTLADDVVELRLLRIVVAADANACPVSAYFLASALEYRFGIHRRCDDMRVGRIHLRMTQDDTIQRVTHEPCAIE